MHGDLGGSFAFGFDSFEGFCPLVGHARFPPVCDRPGVGLADCVAIGNDESPLICEDQAGFGRKQLTYGYRVA